MILGAYARRARSGFTLLEILIVGALIALFSGIAIIAVQSMYDQNRHKVMWPEAQQIGSALSFAYNDLGFYPRLHVLNQQVGTMVITNNSNQLISRPHMDTYGYLNATMKASVVNANWHGPYSAKTQARLSQSQRAYIKMRLPDIQTINYRSLFTQKADIDIYIVDWPADTWSNPWMVYQVSKTMVNGEPVYHLTKPGESPDFKNMVVSYGSNHVPGGNIETQSNLPAYYDFLKNQAALYFEDNVQTNGADYVLRSYGSSQMPLDQLTSDQIRDSFYYPGPGAVDSKTGAVGMLQEGTDDVVWEF